MLNERDTEDYFSAFGGEIITECENRDKPIQNF